MAYIKEKPNSYYNEKKEVTWTKRKCLPCGNIFDSWGIGNRICNKCKSSREYKNDIITTAVKIR